MSKKQGDTDKKQIEELVREKDINSKVNANIMLF